MFRKTIIVCCLLLSFSCANAQKRRVAKINRHQIEFQPHIGISWQSTLFKPVFDFSTIPQFGYLPYPIFHQKSTQGFGLDIGTSVLLRIDKNSALGLKPNARLRYDYVYGVPEFPLYEKEVKAFLLDFSTAIIYTYKNKSDKEWIAEIGYTVNQVGKQYYFDLIPSGGPDHALLKYQYSSLNFGLGYDLYRISKEILLTTSIVANYIPSGHPAYPYRDFMTLGIKATFRFKPESLIFRLK